MLYLVCHFVKIIDFSRYPPRGNFTTQNAIGINPLSNKLFSVQIFKLFRFLEESVFQISYILKFSQA